MTKLNEQIIEKAIAFQNKNWHKRALKLLHEVETKEKTSVLFGLIASSYFQTKNYKNSAKYFKKCLKLNPASKLASLGLFHSLANTDLIKKNKVAKK